MICIGCGETAGSNYINFVRSSGEIGRNENIGCNTTRSVRLVVHLTSGITIKDGSGAESSPYRLSGIDY